MDMKLTLDLSPEFAAALDAFAVRLAGFTEQLVTLTAHLCRAPSLPIAALDGAPQVSAPAKTPPAQAEAAGGARPILDVSSVKLPAAQAASVRASPAFLAGHKNVWTPARVALLRDLYPAGIRPDVILERLAALPGDPISGANAVSVRAALLHLRRAAVKTPAPAASAPAPPAKAAAPPPKPVTPAPTAAPAAKKGAPVEALETIPAKPDQVRHWAQQRGLEFAHSGDLPRINAKRHSLGLPPFVLTSASGRLWGIKL